jgi:hypothetical protein
VTALLPQVARAWHDRAVSDRAYVLPYREREREESHDETSSESFDRMAFAESALSLLRPRHTTVALCPARAGAQARVEIGRAWGKADGARWAMVTIPANASRSAIARAVAALANASSPPYAVDILHATR